MHCAPTASELLDAWEHGRFRTAVERARLLVALALPEASPADLDRLGIGRRDQALLDLRERVFGPRMTGVAQCPACAEEAELEFAIADIRSRAASDPGEAQILRAGGYELRFRLPTCDDLDALAALGDASSRRSVLLQRCVTETRLDGRLTPTGSLPDEVAAALSARMAELDPQGDVRLDLSCPGCRHRWQAPLDIASYLWSEIHAWAERMLRDIHTLASAYGWREADILGMGPARRQAYLELIRQ